MMSKISNIILILFVFFHSKSIFSQDEKKVNEILSKSESVYKVNKNLSLSLNYKLYTTYSSNVVSEGYNGRLLIQNESTYIKIHNTEFLQNPAISLKINHDQKMMIVFNMPEKNIELNPTNLTSLLKSFKTRKVIDKGNYWVCTLQTGKYTQMIYGKVELHINKKTHKITKQILYFLEKAMYKDSKGNEKYDYPRLEIVISDIEVSESEKKSAFDIKTYITKEGNKILPSKKYSNYTLHKN